MFHLVAAPACHAFGRRCRHGPPGPKMFQMERPKRAKSTSKTRHQWQVLMGQNFRSIAAMFLHFFEESLTEGLAVIFSVIWIFFGRWMEPMEHRSPEKKRRWNWKIVPCLGFILEVCSCQNCRRTVSGVCCDDSAQTSLQVSDGQGLVGLLQRKRAEQSGHAGHAKEAGFWLLIFSVTGCNQQLHLSMSQSDNPLMSYRLKKRRWKRHQQGPVQFRKSLSIQMMRTQPAVCFFLTKSRLGSWSCYECWW